jgi:hypothetical protein
MTPFRSFIRTHLFAFESKNGKYVLIQDGIMLKGDPGSDFSDRFTPVIGIRGYQDPRGRV